MNKTRVCFQEKGNISERMMGSWELARNKPSKLHNFGNLKKMKKYGCNFLPFRHLEIHLEKSQNQGAVFPILSKDVHLV